MNLFLFFYWNQIVGIGFFYCDAVSCQIFAEDEDEDEDSQRLLSCVSSVRSFACSVVLIVNLMGYSIRLRESQA